GEVRRGPEGSAPPVRAGAGRRAEPASRGVRSKNGRADARGGRGSFGEPGSRVQSGEAAKAALASSKGGCRGDQEREAEPAGDRIAVPGVVGRDGGGRAAAALPGVRPAGARSPGDDAAR